jgi:hypothetical protein
LIEQIKHSIKGGELHNWLSNISFTCQGVVAERFKAAVLKTAKGESPS